MHECFSLLLRYCYNSVLFVFSNCYSIIQLYPSKYTQLDKWSFTRFYSSTINITKHQNNQYFQQPNSSFSVHSIRVSRHHSCKFLAPRFNAYPWISPHHLHRSSSLVHLTQYNPSHLRHRLTSVDISWQIKHCKISVVSTTVGRIVAMLSNHFLQATLSFPFDCWSVLFCLSNHARKLPLSWTSAIQRLHAFLSVMLLV